MAIIMAIWHNKAYLVLTSAILLSLSFPPFPLPFLEIPAFILLLRLATVSASNREAAYLSYVSFVLWNLLVTYWLMLATFAGGVAAILANSAIMTIPLVTMRSIQRHIKNRWVVALFQASAWTLYEYLHHQWDLAWPWLTLGNAWSMLPETIQYISVTGVWGITFWVIFSSSLIYRAIISNRGFSTAFLVTAILPLLSIAMLIVKQNTFTHSNKRANVVVTQPNFNSYLPFGGFESKTNALDHLFKETEKAISDFDSTDIIFWPENAIQPALYEHEKDNLTQKLRSKSIAWNIPIVTGTTYYDFYESDELPSLVRSYNGQHYIYYNAAVGFFPDNTKTVYFKSRLVPIVERIPFLNFLNSYNLFGIDWSSMSWYGRGKNRVLFSHQDIKVPALICYESVYPGLVREFINKDANLIAVITNDGWWGSTSGHIQHFHYARLRAIETRRWVVRSANNGISGFLSPTGKIIESTRYHTTATIAESIPLVQYKSWYVRFGDWLPFTSALFVVLYSGYRLRRYFLNRP